VEDDQGTGESTNFINYVYQSLEVRWCKVRYWQK